MEVLFIETKVVQCVTAMVAVAALAACAERGNSTIQGYAEGEYVRIAAPFAGSLQQLHVTRGSQVKAGDPLFTLEQENEAAARREAEERLRNTEAQLADLKKSKRPSEIDAARAQLEQARASLRQSEVNLQRQQKLLASNFVSKAAVDDASASFARDKARVSELEALLTTARLAARQDEIRASEYNAGAARAALAQADWKLAQKSVRSPVTGLVNDTNYVLGEWVPAGSPVVSMLPPQNIKVRFFVGESVLGALKLGEPVSVRCDGCAAPIPAMITFISPQAEYTPPVIYSRETRTKLVYLIEARSTPDDAVKLHPGQPVEVTLGR
jgi:HlyD family secretion protein